MKKISNFKFSFSLVCALFATLSMNADVINHNISSGRLIINGNSNDDYVITGSTSNTNNYVEVQFGYKGTITLSNCSFNFTSSGVHSPIRICGMNNLSNTDPSRTNVNIILDGDNYIYNSSYGRACIQVDQGAQINISAIEPCNNSSGTLTAIQMDTNGGAAIGSLNQNENTNETTATVLLSNGYTGTTAGGNVVISSGTITAKGGHGAGIGGGYETYYDGMIVIYGGIVDATTIRHSAGIGSGCPTGYGLVTEYAPNSAIVAIPPAVISAQGAGGTNNVLFPELGLAGTKVCIYIGDPAKPTIKVYTEDYLPDANIYVDLSQDPDIKRVVTATVDASLLDINQVLFGSTDASGIYSTTGQLQNNTTFFTDATSKSAASLGRPYLPTVTALPNGGDVKLNLLEANFTIKNFGAKILETSYTEQQATDSATCIKITYNDNIPITDLNFDFANGSSTDFCQPIFFDSDSMTVIPAPTSFQNGDIYYVTIPIQNSKPSKVYSDVLRIIGNWNGVSTSYIRQIINQIVAYTHSEYICEGESYLFHDQVLTEPGQYTNVTSTSGCNPESEVELLYLTVGTSYDIEELLTVCQNELPYSWRDTIFGEESVSGVYIFNRAAVNGCDSIVKLNLTVNPAYESLIIDTICQWDSYLQNGFVFDSMPAGIYFDTLFLSTIYGCDSIVKLNLTVGETYYYDIYDSICEGEDYQLYGLNIIQPSEGTFEHISNLGTTLGCDSLFNVNLKVINKYNNITIDGIENILVSTDLVTGCYKYTIDVTEDADQYKWEISNKDWQIYPNNNECLVLATTPAQCTLSVSAGNSCGIASDFIELNAGFIGDQNNSRVTMYPNPVKDFVNIQQNDITKISVYDSYGQLVMRKEYNFDSHVTLDFSSLESSIYIIEIITLDKTYVERISIVK